MFEKIDTQEIFSPQTSATKVKGINQRDGNMKQKRFLTQLREEEKKNKDKNKKRHDLENLEFKNKGKREKKLTKADDSELPESDMKKDTQGKVIDILA